MRITTSLHKWLSCVKNETINIVAPVYGTKRVFFYTMGKRLDLDNPRDINEKIQYLKLNDYRNNPMITRCIDKYEVRGYLSELGYERLLPKLYGVFSNVRQIDWGVIPEQFVLKCTHGSGYNIICNDKEDLDKRNAVKQLNKWMHEYYGRRSAEVQYRHIKPRIIAEEFLGEKINTYKFYCFNGVPRVMYVSFMGEDGEKDKYIDFYDMDCNRLDLKLEGHDNSPYDFDMPDSFEEMKKISGDLSKDFKFVRVDLYEVSRRIYFGSITNFM